MKRCNDLPLANNKTRKSIFTRVVSLVGAFMCGFLSFVCFVPTDNVNAMSTIRYSYLSNTVSGLFDGFTLHSKGLISYDTENGATESQYTPIGRYNHYTHTHSYNEDIMATIITSADMSARKTGNGLAAINNLYFPYGNDISVHQLHQQVSGGDYEGNYYLYSYACNSINFTLQTPRIIYIDRNLTSTNKLMLYCTAPYYANELDKQRLYAYRFGFSYRDMEGNLRYYEQGDYAVCRYNTVYDNAMFWNFSEIRQQLDNLALRNGNVFLIEDMYFNTNTVFLTESHLFDFEDEFAVPEAQKYRLLFPEKSPYDLADNSNYAQYIQPYYTYDICSSQYINFPMNTISLQEQNNLTLEASNLWLQYAYNDNYGVWGFFSRFMNIEVFPNFKLSYLIIIGFGILLLSTIYKFIVV